MTRFQDLSNELLLGILDKVLPDDIVSIALASKRIHQLALPRLEEHCILQKQYTNSKNEIKHEFGTWCDPGWLLADLLCKIMSDARIGHYVRKLDFCSWNSLARDGWRPDEVFEKQGMTGKSRLQPSLRTNMEIIEEAVRGAEIIPLEEVDDWLHQIRRGNEDPLVALLLLYAHRLHTVRFVVPYDYSYLLKTIQRIAMQESTVKPYLSYLQSVEIVFAEEWGNMEFLESFMSLPSLTSIETDQLFVDGRTYDGNSAISTQPSNVKEVYFRNGYLPESAFSGLLRGMKNLKTFHYDFRHMWRDMDYTPPFHCLAVLDSLVANAGHTLERLTLSAHEIETSQISPLRAFHTLREIEIRTHRCFAVGGAKIPAKLVTSLPVSLERLAMYWFGPTSVDATETLIEAIVGFVRESTTQLLHLRKLHLSTQNSGEHDALGDCLWSDETAQINPLLSFYIGHHGGQAEMCAWADNVCTCGQDCFGHGSR